MRRRSSAFTSFSFACSRLRIVCRKHREPSIAPFLSADVREAEEVERFRLPFSALLSVLDREWSELQQARFLRVQFKVELPHSFRQFSPKLLGIRFILESNHDVVSKPHDDHITVGLSSTPRLDPQVKHVVEIDVGQQRRGASALGRPFFHPHSLPYPPTRRRSAISG